MKTIFMSTENSRTNESNKFIYRFTDKLNLKSPNNKNIGFITHGRILIRKMCITAINLIICNLE